MQWVDLVVHSGWSCSWSGLPIRRPKDKEEAEEFSQDLCHIRRDDLVYSIDIGWSPEGELKGNFLCRVIHEDDWNSPVERTEIETPSGVFRWFCEMLERYSP